MYSLKNTTIQEVLEFLDNAPDKLEKRPIREQYFDKTVQYVKDWQKEIEQFLTLSIVPNANLFIKLLDDRNSYIFDDFLINKSSDFVEKLQHLQSQVRRVKCNIEIVKKYILACDALLGKPTGEINLTCEKFDYVLKILNQFAGDGYHAVQDIFDLNSIALRSGEAVEIAQELKRKGHAIISSDYYDKDIIKITVKGSAYIERKIQPPKKNSGKRAKDKKLDARIDEVIQRLIKLGYGQEVVFKELEEMRDQQEKLSKKSWGQLLKGKLIDLAVTEVINKKVAAEVYSFLTDEGMKLIK